MPKSNNFQILLDWMYLLSFRWIYKIPFKLSSRQAYKLRKDIFGHVISLIAYTCQIWKESAQRSQSYKENNKINNLYEVANEQGPGQ